jgi:ATP-binding cassette subfamily B protein
MMLAMGLGEPLSKLARFIESITMIKRKSQAINEMLASEELDLNENNLALVNHNITFDNVSFAYDQEEVLNDINFLAEQDTVTALVGESGSGKSTIAKLIVRFWDPQKGKIRLDGVDIKELSFAQLMEKISYVSQDIYLFDTTIRENIRMGDLTATDKKVEEAAKLAQCHEFIKELENGYDTLTGDAGNKLSGGQKQRISIARSLLKDAPIIILDEATAFTDPENEDRIQMALNDLIEGKTLLVIAHRLSTITGADNIILMDQGQIAAQGTHQQLLKKSAIYKKLWQAHREAMEWDIKVEGVKANV